MLVQTVGIERATRMSTEKGCNDLVWHFLDGLRPYAAGGDEGDLSFKKTARRKKKRWYKN